MKAAKNFCSAQERRLVSAWQFQRPSLMVRCVGQGDVVCCPGGGEGKMTNLVYLGDCGLLSVARWRQSRSLGSESVKPDAK